jgi:hypothetical protein
MSPFLFAVAVAGVSRDAWLIEPGRRVGNLTIGRTLERDLVSLGPQAPGAEGDAAMGHIWHRWVGRTGHELDVYTVRGETGADTDNFVTQVRVTSPAFHTADGLHVGSPYPQIAGRFPIRNSVKTRPGWRLIDDRRGGIAIEVTAGHCAGIVVHPRGQGVLQTYSPYPGYDFGG